VRAPTQKVFTGLSYATFLHWFKAGIQVPNEQAAYGAVLQSVLPHLYDDSEASRSIQFVNACKEG
jgi:hypothetical protein